ncbi:ABC transporter permease [Mycetocola miduiensis]|uniref:Peptide/nickel transport system permease protein n=1 Tax=Mycetocola miduiensis TaxID=995034 RepID=A0A1I4Z5Z2_9MICO|nr:ABC transporter permease [Mycetocola miduiensis]SFN45433.1 peptide/nickel transport system permease protein [Mycetocola miduiensis]
MSDLTQAALAPGGGRTMERARALVRSRSGLIGLILIAMLTVLSLFSAFGWLPYDPIAQDPPSRLQPPSSTHFFGTDQFGRDVFSRVAAGVANSALIAVVAVAVAAIIGTLCGVIAGFYRGVSDGVISGVTNVLFAFPPLLLALSLASVFNRNWFTIAMAIAIVYVPIFIRVTRGPVLSLREIEYVKAATSTGQSRSRVMFRHVLPNITSIIIVQVTLSLSWAVLTEAALSFLGLGTPPPAASLGSMIFDARTLVTIAPWTMIAPGVVVVLLVVGLNLLGDGLRDALDPRNRGKK